MIETEKETVMNINPQDRESFILRCIIQLFRLKKRSTKSVHLIVDISL